MPTHRGLSWEKLRVAGGVWVLGNEDWKGRGLWLKAGEEDRSRSVCLSILYYLSKMTLLLLTGTIKVALIVSLLLFTAFNYSIVAF